MKSNEPVFRFPETKRNITQDVPALDNGASRKIAFIQNTGGNGGQILDFIRPYHPAESSPSVVYERTDAMVSVNYLTYRVPKNHYLLVDDNGIRVVETIPSEQPPTPAGSLIHLIWVDSQLHPQGWQHTENIDMPEEHLMQSIGWIIKESETAITVCGHMSADGDQCCGIMTIPVCAVRSRRVLS